MIALLWCKIFGYINNFKLRRSIISKDGDVMIVEMGRALNNESWWIDNDLLHDNQKLDFFNQYNPRNYEKYNRNTEWLRDRVSHWWLTSRGLSDWPYRITTQCSCYPVQKRLTYWGRDEMNNISQTTFSNVFCSMKMFESRLKFHWSLFPRVQLTIYQHWFR